MVEHIFKNIEAKEAEAFLSALHAVSELSPQALREFYCVMEKEKQKGQKKSESGIFHRMKGELTKIKFDLASYIYF